MKKLENKYIYAGITAFCVLMAVLICGFIFFNFDVVTAAFGKLNSALTPIYIGLSVKPNGQWHGENGVHSFASKNQ